MNKTDTPIEGTSWRCLCEFDEPFGKNPGAYWDAIFITNTLTVLCVLRVRDKYFVSRRDRVDTQKEDLGPYDSVYDAISAAETISKLNGNIDEMFTCKR